MEHYKHWIRGPKEWGPKDWGPKDWGSMDWGSMDQAPEDLESLGCMAVLLQDRNVSSETHSILCLQGHAAHGSPSSDTRHKVEL